jgi:fluoroacetyl-CoA thioesterase
MAVTPGLRATVDTVVTSADTAQALGSGEVAVLGTPRVVALAEAATVRAVAGHLEPGCTTVGARVEVDHLAPTSVGTAVHVAAELTEIAGARLVFHVVVQAGDALAARARIVRVVVEAATFGR